MNNFQDYLRKQVMLCLYDKSDIMYCCITMVQFLLQSGTIKNNISAKCDILRHMLQFQLSSLSVMILFAIIFCTWTRCHIISHSNLVRRSSCLWNWNIIQILDQDFNPTSSKIICSLISFFKFYMIDAELSYQLFFNNSSYPIFLYFI